MRRRPDSERLYALIGERVGRLRKSARLSQTKLAARCGLTRGSVANIELGRQRPTLHTLAIVADALSVELATLIPTKAERDGAVAEGIENLRTTRRVEVIAGEGSSKVVSFIATKRHEVRSDDPTTSAGRDREEGATSLKTGGDRVPSGPHRESR